MNANAPYYSPCCDVEYLSRQNVVFVTWKQFCAGDAYRNPLRRALEILQNNPHCQYVADTRSGFENEAADTQWLFDFFLPTAAATDCHSIFFIIDQTNSLKEELEGQSAELRKLFRVHFCYSLQDVERILSE